MNIVPVLRSDDRRALSPRSRPDARPLPGPHRLEASRDDARRNVPKASPWFASNLAAVAALCVAVGCAPAALTLDAGLRDDGGLRDAGGAVERGPKSIPIEGDPNGLWWDAPSQTLYIADDQNNRILKWTDAQGVTVAAQLPAAPANGPLLGQLVRTADGTLVVVRFGSGTAGDVVFVRPDGTSGVVPNLPLERRRIGLTVAPDGTLYDAYFVRNANLNVGSVARLELSGSETEVLGGLGKTVGVLVVDQTLFVSDQTGGKVLRAPLATPSMLSTFATIASPDLLAAGPDGALLTGSRQGNVFAMDAAGDVSVFAGGFQEVRGVAWDAANRRVFASDHDPDAANGTTHFLQIIPAP